MSWCFLCKGRSDSYNVVSTYLGMGGVGSRSHHTWCCVHSETVEGPRSHPQNQGWCFETWDYVVCSALQDKSISMLPGVLLKRLMTDWVHYDWFQCQMKKKIPHVKLPQWRIAVNLLAYKLCFRGKKRNLCLSPWVWKWYYNQLRYF